MDTEHESFDDLDLDRESFRELGYRVIDLIADYFDSIREVPVFPRRTSAQVSDAFDDPLPEEGEDPDAILDDWTGKILPNSTHLGSPRYFGFVNGSGTMISVLAEALASAVNMNPGT